MTTTNSLCGHGTRCIQHHATTLWGPSERKRNSTAMASAPPPVWTATTTLMADTIIPPYQLTSRPRKPFEFVYNTLPSRLHACVVVIMIEVIECIFVRGLPEIVVGVPNIDPEHSMAFPAALPSTHLPLDSDAFPVALHRVLPRAIALQPPTSTHWRR